MDLTRGRLFKKLSNAPFLCLIVGQHIDRCIKITQSLRSLIITQILQAPLPDVSCIKAQIHQDRCSVQKGWASTIRSNLPLPSQRALCKLGASSWLTALPFGEQGFHFMKQKFWDALHLRCIWLEALHAATVYVEFHFQQIML